MSHRLCVLFLSNLLPPPRSKTRTFFSRVFSFSIPNAIAAAVGSLMIRTTFNPGQWKESKGTIEQNFLLLSRSPYLRWFLRLSLPVAARRWSTQDKWWWRASPVDQESFLLSPSSVVEPSRWFPQERIPYLADKVSRTRTTRTRTRKDRPLLIYFVPFSHTFSFHFYLNVRFSVVVDNFVRKEFCIALDFWIVPATTN